MSKALDALTPPNATQVNPSVEYCQVPLPVLPVMAIPFRAPLSTSAQLAPVRIVLARVPLEVVFSSVPLRVTVAPLLSVGASLTAVIAVDSVAVAAAIAVVPPLVVVLTVTRVSLPAVLE